jgi:hypothetical protein
LIAQNKLLYKENKVNETLERDETLVFIARAERGDAGGGRVKNTTWQEFKDNAQIICFANGAILFLWFVGYVCMPAWIGQLILVALIVPKFVWPFMPLRYLDEVEKFRRTLTDGAEMSMTDRERIYKRILLRSFVISWIVMLPPLVIAYFSLRAFFAGH